MVSNNVDDCLQRQIAKNTFKSKIEARPVKACHEHHIPLQPIWLQTLVAIDSESRLTSFPRFCAPPSEFALLFDSTLSRLPFLGQVDDLDLLLCTGFNSEYVALFLCHIFTQRPITDRKIKRSDGRGFGRQQLLDNSIISHGKKSNSTAADSETLVLVQLDHQLIMHVECVLI